MSLPTPRVGFLDLPPELRNRVYELALHTEPGSFTLKMNSHITHFDTYEERDAQPKPFPPLAPKILATCKQIRAEAMPVLYGNIAIKTCAPVIYAMFDLIERMNMSLYCVRHLDLSDHVPSFWHQGRTRWSKRDIWNFRLLEDLPDLQSLQMHINVGDAEAPHEYDELITDRIFPIVKRMKENRSKIGEPYSLSDMLKLTVGGIKTICQAAEEGEARILALLEEKLKA